MQIINNEPMEKIMTDIKIPLSALRNILIGAVHHSGARIVWADSDGWSYGGFYSNQIRR